MKYTRNCFQRAATIWSPTNVNKLSRAGRLFFPRRTSALVDPVDGRSAGILPPTMFVKVGKKSMIKASREKYCL